MISNERSSFHGYRPPAFSKPPVQEDTLKYGQLDVGSTSFVFMLKQNPRGRFLRITEKSIDGFACLIVPDTGLTVFQELLAKIHAVADAPVTAQQRDIPCNLLTEHVQVERKAFTFKWEHDPLGKFLRIIEHGVRINEIIVLASGLTAFKDLVDEMALAANEQSVIAPAETIAPAIAAPAAETLKTTQLELEGIAFTFMLQKSATGQFLRISQEQNGRSVSCVVPVEHLDEFKKSVMDMAKAAKKLKA